MTHRKQLTQNMEILWSFIIRARDGFRCQIAGKDERKCWDNGSLEAMHIVTRGVKGIKYDLRNGLCGCRAHHQYYTFRPHEWEFLMRQYWPAEWKYLNDKKWQQPDVAIDKVEIFAGLLIEAQKYKHDFPEYLEKIQKIEQWMQTSPAVQVSSVAGDGAIL